MANKTLTQARTAQGPINVTLDTLVGVVRDGQSYVATLSEIAQAIHNYSTVATVQNGSRVKTLTLKSELVNGVIGWHSVVHNEGGYFSAGAPTRFIVPLGVTGVKIAASLQGVFVDASIQIHKNGSLTPVAQNDYPGSSSLMTINIDYLSVQAGDFFEVYVTDVGTYDINVSANTWFEITTMAVQI